MNTEDWDRAEIKSMMWDFSFRITGLKTDIYYKGQGNKYCWAGEL